MTCGFSRSSQQLRLWPDWPALCGASAVKASFAVVVSDTLHERRLASTRLAQRAPIRRTPSGQPLRSDARTHGVDEKMRSKEHILALIQAAFDPLECVAELTDYQTKVGFRVYGADGQPMVTFRPVPVDQLASGPGLVSIIEGARRRVEARGVALGAWAMPRT